jgi:outer membrane protein assembly factor BamB
MEGNRAARRRPKHDPAEVHGIIPALPTDHHVVFPLRFLRHRHCPATTIRSLTRRRRPLARLLVLLVVVCAVALARPAAAQDPEDDEDAEVDRRAAQEEDDDARVDAAAREEGESRADRPIVGRLEIVLTAALEAPASAQAAVLGRTAFVPLRGGRLASVNLDTGATGWVVRAAAEHSPAAGDDLIFLATPDTLVALDPSGAPRWSVPVSGGFSAPPLWDTGWLIATTRSGEVLCLRARDGQVLWTRRVAAPAAARPAIAAARVYVALEDGTVTALDLQTGAVAWEHRLGGRGATPLALDDRVFVGSADKFFYCLSTESGKRRWRWRAGGAVVSEPVVDARHVYFTGLNNVLRALDRFNGSQKWIAGLRLRPLGGPLLLGDLVFLAGVGAEARAFSAADGGLAAEYTGAIDLAAAPQLVPHAIPEFSTVLLLTRDGHLQLLRRHLEIPIVPLTQPFGIPVPLVPPPGFTG